jgi:hypothetical protein
MIVRKDADGMLLVTQTDHSRLAGQFAAHWGNETFAPPTPYESVARAAAFHDFGYLRYETAPAFDPSTGETPMFRAVPTDARRLEEYQWCFDWLLEQDPYASLLVSMHRVGIWRARYNTIASQMNKSRRQGPAIDAFIERQEARRSGIIAEHGFDERQLWTNYRLLQVWDLMSLYFSCDLPAEDSIEPVPTSYRDADAEGVRLTLSPLDATTVAIDPYPFDVGPLRVSLPARRFPQATFEDQAALRKAYFRAPLVLLEFDLVASAASGGSLGRSTGKKPLFLTST